MNKQEFPRLFEVFSDDIVNAFEAKLASSRLNDADKNHLKFFLSVISEKTTNDQDYFFLAPGHNSLMSFWEMALNAAWNCGLMEGKKGDNIRACLRSGKEKAFRSAMAECKACWFFSSHCGLKTSFIPEKPDDGIKTADFDIVLPDNKHMYVEVKSPLKEFKEGIQCGFDGNVKRLSNLLKRSNNKFNQQTYNILFIDSHLANCWIFYDPGMVQITNAFYGDHVIQQKIHIDKGPIGDAKSVFRPNGTFFKSVKKGGGAGFTRVSAIIVLGSADMDKDLRAKHLIAYNPLAEKPLFPDYDHLFNTDKKCVPENGQMIWKDFFVK